MHAKYEVSISNGSKVIAKIKVDNRQTNTQTDKQTGQKQYAPGHSIRGHKNSISFSRFVFLLVNEDDRIDLRLFDTFFYYSFATISLISATHFIGNIL